MRAPRVIVDVAIWLRFLKGLVLVPATISTFAAGCLSSEPTPIVGVASCAAGTLALMMTCVAAWIPFASSVVPQVAVGSIRKTGWSAGSGSSSMPRRQLQVIVLA